MRPDKIYCEDCSDGIYSHIDRWKWDNADNIEYIRKDALLEWLNQGFDWVRTPLISVQQVIDKLNSM